MFHVLLRHIATACSTIGRIPLLFMDCAGVVIVVVIVIIVVVIVFVVVVDKSCIYQCRLWCCFMSSNSNIPSAQFCVVCVSLQSQVSDRIKAHHQYRTKE